MQHVYSSLDAEILVNLITKNIESPLTVKNIYSIFIYSKDITIIPPLFSSHVTKVEVSINKVKIIAVLKTEAPDNVILTNLVKQINLAPDLHYTKNYGTASPVSINAVDAYFSLPMCFGKFVVSTPSIIFIK